MRVTICFTSWVQYPYARTNVAMPCMFFVLLLAYGDCPDDELLLTLHVEEGCLLPVFLSCSASPPQSYTSTLVTPAHCI